MGHVVLVASRATDMAWTVPVPRDHPLSMEAGSKESSRCGQRVREPCDQEGAGGGHGDPVAPERWLQGPRGCEVGTESPPGAKLQEQGKEQRGRMLGSDAGKACRADVHGLAAKASF